MLQNVFREKAWKSDLHTYILFFRFIFEPDLQLSYATAALQVCVYAAAAVRLIFQAAAAALIGVCYEPQWRT